MYVKCMDYCHLGCDTMQFGRYVLVCQGKLLKNTQHLFLYFVTLYAFFVTMYTDTKVFSSFMQSVIFIQVHCKYLLGFCSVEKNIENNPFTKIKQVSDTQSVTVFSLQRDPKTTLNPFNKAIQALRHSDFDFSYGKWRVMNENTTQEYSNMKLLTKTVIYIILLEAYDEHVHMVNIIEFKAGR